MSENIDPDGIQVGFFVYEVETGIIYQISEIDVAGMSFSGVNFLSEEVRTFSVAALYDGRSFGKLLICAPTCEELDEEIRLSQPLVHVANQSGLPETFLKRADFMLKVVAAIEADVERMQAREHAAGRKGNRTDCLRWVCSRYGIGLSTFYDYRRDTTKHHGNRATIAGNMRRSTLGKRRLKSVQVHLIDTVILEWFARPTPPRPSLVYTMAEDLLVRTNKLWVDPEKCPDGKIPVDLVEMLLDPKIPIEATLENPDHAPLLSPVKLPARRWFYYYLADLASQPDGGEEIITARYGKEYWERYYMLYESFLHNASFPLQYVFADHWLIEMFILDDDDKPIRVWVTFIICAYTRCILGYAIRMEEPCIESLTDALKCAIWPHEDILKKYNVEGPWLSFGIPWLLSLDNAWAHHSYTVESLCRLISLEHRLQPDGTPRVDVKYRKINLAFRRPYKGRYGALVERLIGDFADKMRQLLLGAIPECTPKHLRQAAKQAVFKFADLEEFILDLIVKYQNHKHSALDMTPNQKWIEAVEQFGLPKVPARTPERERYFWRELTDTRPIGSQGFSRFDMKYTSDELHSLPRKKDGKNIQYSHRVDPDNIGVLAVFLEDTYQCDVKSTKLLLPDGSVRKMSLESREIAQKQAAQAEGSTSGWLECWEKWQSKGQQRAAEKAARARAQKRSGNGTPCSAQPSSDAIGYLESEPQLPVDGKNHDELMTELLRGFSRS